MTELHEDADFAAQLERTLIGAYSGSADLGEAMATAGRVAAGDYDGWHDQWHATADAARSAATVAEERGDTVATGRAYLRAAEYDRQAYFFLRHDLDDERVLARWQDQREAFRASIPHLDISIVPIEIPFEPVPLTGYLFRARGEAPAPLVILPGGFDGVAEEYLKYGARAAVDRGWHAVSFDGPGQGELLVRHRLAMRPDFETVLRPVVDWAIAQPFVDPDALLLVGRSLGGYLGPRGVADEPRIAAMVCDPGQYEFASRFRSSFSDGDWQRLLDADPALDADLQGFLEGPRNTEFWGSRMAAMGAATYGELLRTLLGYSLEGRADRIGCPTLVTEGEGDFASQSQRLYDALTGEKELRRFTAVEGAPGHCESMGQQLWEGVAFGWLSGIVAR